MAILLDGKKTAAAILDKHRRCVEALGGQDVYPTLAVVLVGQNAASEAYARGKEKACAELGVLSRIIRLPENVSQRDLEYQIEALNDDADVHGILVYLPLPAHINAGAALARLRADKDVDGATAWNAGQLFLGGKGMLPCTAKGIVRLLKAYNVPLDGKRAVVVGRSNIVGKPAALLLLNENCTVTLAHSHTQDLAQLTRQADILVAAVGRPRFISADMVKPGAAVIDVGVNRVDGKMVGDVNFDEVEKVAGYLSPVPGGVGRMTVCMLLENTLEAACRASR